MSFGNDIPEFAMLPAKDPEEQITVPAAEDLKWDSIKVTKLVEPERITFTMEEDVLVPDTHPDMKEILMIDGRAVLDECELEMERNGKGEACGIIELQVLYMPEKAEENQLPLDVKTGLRFRQNVLDGSAGMGKIWLDASVVSVESMIINERKYRVKINVSIAVSRFETWEREIFQSIEGEDMEYLKEKVEICDASDRVRDVLEISEELGAGEDVRPVKILRQDIQVIENYRQAASEKVVINGFIMVSVMYCGQDGNDDSENQMVRQLQEKVEFTQFIPLQNHAQWQASRAVYDTSDLKVKLTDEDSQMCSFMLEGSLVTRVALIKSVEKELVVDAYHRKKDFICDYERLDSPVYSGVASGETGVREIISFDEETDTVEGVCFVCGNVTQVSCRMEGGKPVAEGSVKVKVLCRRSGGGYAVCRKELPFRCVLSSGQPAGGDSVRADAFIKEIWAEKITGKQLEVNLSMNVQAFMMKESGSRVVRKPAFRDCGKVEETSPVIIYVAKEGDTAWSIARKFKTGKLSICEYNNVENEEISAGKKLLIMR